ncbi:MAG: transcriptional regulator [Saprospiraceae bacterium]
MKKSTQTLFKFKLLKSEKEYDQALARLKDIFDSPSNSVKGQEAELLALLIEEYEEEHYKIDSPDPIAAIRIRMEEMQLKQKDQVNAIGSEGIVSEVLNRKRKLTVKMVRNLSEKLRLPSEVLIKDYDLTV